MSKYARSIVFRLGGPLSLLLFCAAWVSGINNTSAYAIQSEQESGDANIDATWLSAIVTNSSIPLDLRVGAARRMAASNNPKIVEAFAELLRTADDQQLQILASGVREAQNIPAVAIPAAISHACAAGVLKGEHMTVLRIGGEASIDALRQAILEGDVTCHPIAIRALGSMKSRAAAESLVQLLDVIEPDSQNYVALDRALQTYADGDEQRSAQEWREWWASIEEPSTSGQSMELLEARLEDAIARADRAEQRALQLAKRLATNLERLLASMADADREARIVELTRDEESLIRLGAVQQVGQMLRNGRTPSDELRNAMVILLDDTDPTIRIEAAQLLDAMWMDDFGPRLVQAIGDEDDPLVLVAVFEILGNRPVPEIVPIAVKHFGDREPMVSDAAAGAISAVGRAGFLDEAMRNEVRAGLDARKGGIDSQSLATVAVLAAKDEEKAMEYLNSESDVVRYGAAFGMHYRGARHRLLEATEDPLVARVAVRAWSDPPVSLSSLDALMSLEPVGKLPADNDQWAKAVNDVLASMPPDSVVKADEQLANRTEFFDARRDALRRTATTQEVNEAIRYEAARRHANRLVENGQPLEAAAELRTAGATPSSPLGEDLFSALVLGKSWDEAALVRPEPDAWLGVLEAQLNVRPDLAENLVVVIEERFGPELTVKQRRTLDDARRLASPAEGETASVKTATGEAQDPENKSGSR